MAIPNGALHRVLEFNVTGQRLMKSPNCDFGTLVAGSVGYLKAKFIFSSEWTSCKKAASFWVGDEEYPVLLDETDTCVIPAEATKNVRFGVSAFGMTTDGKKIPTTKIVVMQEVY